MIAVTLDTEHATATLARTLAAVLDPPEVILLTGDVGVGKTTFVRFLADALGCTDIVRSPTYTIAHEYTLPRGRRLAHLDLYRSTAIDASAWADLEPALESDVVAVEWPQAALGWLGPTVTWKIELAHLGGDRRLARVHATDPGVGRNIAMAIAPLLPLRA